MKYKKMKELHDMITSWSLLNDISEEFLLHFFIGGVLAILEVNNVSYEVLDRFFNEAKEAYKITKVNDE